MKINKKGILKHNEISNCNSVSGDIVSIKNNGSEDFANLKIFGNTTQANTILPGTYQQVEYIESTGTQYINTGIALSATYMVKTSVMWTEGHTTNRQLFGANTAGQYWGISTDYKYECGPTWVSNINCSTTTYDDIIIDTKNENCSVIVNGENAITRTGVGAAANPHLLFDINAVNYDAFCKIRYYIIYDNNTLVRHFIPCYRKSDNVIGMYDLVNDVFYTNSGTGTFNKGTNVQVPMPEYPQEIQTIKGDTIINIKGKNLFNKSSITQNYYFDKNGNTIYNTAWCASDYIKVISSEQYAYQGITNNGNSPYSCYYDNNKELVSTFKQQSGVNTIIIPDNVTYIRFSLSKSNTNLDIDTFQIERGEATEYESYKENNYAINLPVENLVDFSNISYITGNSATVTRNNGEYSIVNTDSKWGCAWFTQTDVQLEVNTTYTFSALIKSTTSSTGSALGVVYRASSTGETIFSASGFTGDRVFITFTTPSVIIGENLFGFYPMEKNATAVFTDVQLEKGIQRNSYTPYGITPIELCKIQEYNATLFRDYIYKKGNKWFVHKEVKKTINAENLISTTSIGTDGKRHALINKNDLGIEYGVHRYSLLCNKFSEHYGASTNRYIGCFQLGMNNTYVLFIIENQYNTVAKVQAAYPNITTYGAGSYSEEIEINNSNLINQLNAIKLFPGINYVTITNVNLPAFLEIQYIIKNTQIYDDKIISYDFIEF